MRQSVNKTGFTKVDHTTFDVILPLLSTAAQSVFLRIYRQTVGWGKPYDQISLSLFRKKTGIKHDDTISAAIQELKDMDLIIVAGKRTQKRSYGINWDTVEAYIVRYDDELFT